MSNQPMIVRHKLIDRICHWVIVFVGLVTFLTGFAFFFPSFQWLSGIVGTPQLAKVMHPFFGIAMCVLLAVMLLRYYNHNKWNRYDLPWMKPLCGFCFRKRKTFLQLVITTLAKRCCSARLWFSCWRLSSPAS